MDIEGNAVEALKSIEKAYEQINKAAKEALKATEGIGGGTNTPPKPPTPSQLTGRELKKDFRKDKEDLLQMAMAGDTSSESFRKMQEKAGEFRDTMDEVNARVKFFSSDTQTLDVAVESLAGLGAVAQIGVGGMELLGLSTESAQKTVAKLASIEAVLTGVKQIQNMVQKESVFMLGMAEAKTKVLTFATGAYSAVVGTSTGALKAFRIALASSGIGLAVVALGALASAFMSVTDESNNLEKAESDRQQKVNDGIQTNIDKIEKNKIALRELRVEVLRSQGKNKEADELEAKYAQDKINEMITNEQNLSKARTIYSKKYEEETKNTRKLEQERAELMKQENGSDEFNQKKNKIDRDIQASKDLAKRYAETKGVVETNISRVLSDIEVESMKKTINENKAKNKNSVTKRS